ncbi:carboxypeptidase regulatory-like domain-containing protein, partial [Corynebacterium phocae]|uniref:carboxypeptidase regulatory-like domain-containing protein n=1 Tax=Corynebacterium phocae TaxID=161895 RepID=UPI0014781C61
MALIGPFVHAITIPESVAVEGAAQASESPNGCTPSEVVAPGEEKPLKVPTSHYINDGDRNARETYERRLDRIQTRATYFSEGGKNFVRINHVFNPNHDEYSGGRVAGQWLNGKFSLFIPKGVTVKSLSVVERMPSDDSPGKEPTWSYSKDLGPDGESIENASVTIDDQTGKIAVSVPKNSAPSEATVYLKDAKGNAVGNPIDITVTDAGAQDQTAGDNEPDRIPNDGALHTIDERLENPKTGLIGEVKYKPKPAGDSTVLDAWAKADGNANNASGVGTTYYGSVEKAGGVFDTQLSWLRDTRYGDYEHRGFAKKENYEGFKQKLQGVLYFLGHPGTEEKKDSTLPRYGKGFHNSFDVEIVYRLDGKTRPHDLGWVASYAAYDQNWPIYQVYTASDEAKSKAVEDTGSEIECINQESTVDYTDVWQPNIPEVTEGKFGAEAISKEISFDDVRTTETKETKTGTAVPLAKSDAFTLKPDANGAVLPEDRTKVSVNGSTGAVTLASGVPHGEYKVPLEVTYVDGSKDLVLVPISVLSSFVDEVPADGVAHAIDDKVAEPKSGMSGTVTDSSGAVVDGAVVTVDSATGVISVTVPEGTPLGEGSVQITDADGAEVGSPIAIDVVAGAITSGTNVDEVPADGVAHAIDDKVAEPKSGMSGTVTDSSG